MFISGEDLNKGKTKLEDIIRRMEDEMIEINDCKQQLNAKNAQLSELISKCDDSDKTVDIDEAFGPTQPLYKQILNAFAEENAIVDAIYYLSEALRKGVIDLELFLKVNTIYLKFIYNLIIFLTFTARERTVLSSVYVESIDESLQRKSRSSPLDILRLYYFKNYINDY